MVTLFYGKKGKKLIFVLSCCVQHTLLCMFIRTHAKFCMAVFVLLFVSWSKSNIFCCCEKETERGKVQFDHKLYERYCGVSDVPYAIILRYSPSTQINSVWKCSVRLCAVYTIWNYYNAKTTMRLSEKYSSAKCVLFSTVMRQPVLQTMIIVCGAYSHTTVNSKLSFYAEANKTKYSTLNYFNASFKKDIRFNVIDAKILTLCISIYFSSNLIHKIEDNYKKCCLYKKVSALCIHRYIYLLYRAQMYVHDASTGYNVCCYFFINYSYSVNTKVGIAIVIQPASNIALATCALLLKNMLCLIFYIELFKRREKIIVQISQLRISKSFARGTKVYKNLFFKFKLPALG